MMVRLFAPVCALLLLAQAMPAAAAQWMESWAASPAPPQPAVAGMDARWATPSFNDQTLVQVVRLSAGGERLRVRFTNEYGQKSLVIGAARVALLKADGEPAPGPDHVLTFGGRPTAVVPPGAPMLSDPVDMPTTALAGLKIVLYLPGAAPLCTCHMSGGQTVMVSPAGDYTARAFTSVADPSASYHAFLSAVDVERRVKGPVIVAFGDSITDGYRSTDNANRRWPDRLTERLEARSKGRPIAVVNAGIGGNRVLSDGFIAIFGKSALARFDRDVLAVPGASHLIILEGVNDLGGPSPPSADDLIAGYRQLIARARDHGIKVYGATILPYEGAAYFKPQGEVVRQAVNQWIRTGGAFDGVIDFDALMRDPAHPSRMIAGLQSGDWLHPNDAGYRAMGDAVDLSLFR